MAINKRFFFLLKFFLRARRAQNVCPQFVIGYLSKKLNFNSCIAYFNIKRLINNNYMWKVTIN